MAKRIFIIEDDENILYGLQDRFTSDGYEVEISSADEDLDFLITRIKKNRPNFLILDILLPKMDGLEIIKTMKGDEDISEAQVLIFTDLSDEDGKTRSSDLGINHYFLKSEMDVNEFVDRAEIIMEGETEDEVERLEEDAEEDDIVLE
jgi:DNA-binding response OmpR family regulator